MNEPKLKRMKVNMTINTTVPTHFSVNFAKSILFDNTNVCSNSDRVTYSLTKGVVANIVAAIQRLCRRKLLPSGEISIYDDDNVLNERRCVMLLRKFLRGVCSGLDENIIENDDMMIQVWNDGKAFISKCAHELDMKAARVYWQDPYILASDVDGQAPVSDATVQALKEMNERHSRKWLSDKCDPFGDFSFSMPPSSLIGLERRTCPTCDKRAYLYCSKCMVCIDPTVALPQFKLNVKIELLHHWAEKLSKSTGIHAKVFAPESCTVHHLTKGDQADTVPVYDPDTTVVLYPDESAVSLDKISLEKVDTVVVIEATWQRAMSALRHPNLRDLRHVKLKPQQTTYWREQTHGTEFLATIEAIFYICKELCGDAYQHDFDDLLLIYASQHGRVLSGSRTPKVWTAKK